MVDSVGEHDKAYVSRSPEGIKPTSSRRWKIANKLGIASVVAAFGFLGSTTGHSPTEVAQDTAGAAGDVARDFTKGVGNALERVDNNLDSHFPEPYKEPQEGK